MFSIFGKSRARKLTDLLMDIESAGVMCSSEAARKQVLSEVEAQTGGQGAPAEAILCAMGDEQYDAKAHQVLPWLSEDVWHFDYEAIEDHGHYKSIVQKCVGLSGGELDINGIADFVDIENDVAWVEFTHRGMATKIELAVDNDWADPQLFARLNVVLAGNGSKRVFAQHDLGQDCLIVCRTASEISTLNKIPGLAFHIIEG